MHVCPNCKVEFRQRRNGGCPHCGEPLKKYGDTYYSEKLGSPPQSLLSVFEKLVSEQLSRKNNMKVTFYVSKRTARYPREIVEAKRLLDICAGDYELAVEILNTLFTHRDFAWKQRNSLIGLQKDFEIVKVLVEARRVKLAQIDTAQAQTFERVMQQEDVFAL